MALSRRHRSGKTRQRRTAASAAAALAVTALFIVMWAGPNALASDRGHPSAVASPTREWTKYYIVLPPEDGHKEFLYEIAAKTLGNGNLAMTIFQLNKGRLEPDGRRVETPTVILPGWILVLPASAAGPGVHYGPLPAASPPAAAGSPAPSVPKRTSGTQHGATGAATASRRPSLRVTEHQVVVGSMILLALLFVARLTIAIRRRLTARENPGPDDGLVTLLSAPKPPSGRPITDRPDDRDDAGSGAYQIPAFAGPDPSAWSELPAALGHLAEDSAVNDDIPEPDMPDTGNGPGAWATPAAADEVDSVAWPDYLKPGMWHRDNQSSSNPSDDIADHPGAEPAALADMPPATEQSGAWSDEPAPQPATPNGAAPNAAGPYAADANAAGPYAAGPYAAGPYAAGANGAGPYSAGPYSAGPHSTGSAPGSAAGAPGSSARFPETVAAQEHEVSFGKDRIHVVLANPDAFGNGTRRNGHTDVAPPPNLVWTPLPYDIPVGGGAFACLGAGEEGCLFVDLAAAPAAVAIGGDSQAAVRLAESIAHQLCISAADNHCLVVVIGDALPPPQPPGAACVSSLRELADGRPLVAGDGTEIVFCHVRSGEDHLALKRYVFSAGHRVVAVILGNPPDAPWSFTAEPSRQPSDALHSMIT